MNVTDLFDKGGLVVWILAAYSVIGLAIILERYLLFLRNPRFSPELQGQLGQLLTSRDGIEQIKKQRNPEGRVLAEVIDAHRLGVADLVGVASRQKAVELQSMESGLRTLGVLGNTAPLLGLLGTITGMIKAFMVIEMAGGKVDAQALAGGIWEAMLTTGVGLAVAIPLLIFLHFLEGMVERRLVTVEQCVSLLLERSPNAPTNQQDYQTTQSVPHWEDCTDGL